MKINNLKKIFSSIRLRLTKKKNSENDLYENDFEQQNSELPELPKHQSGKSFKTNLKPTVNKLINKLKQNPKVKQALKQSKVEDIQWAEIPEKIFDPIYFEKIHFYFKMTLIVMIAYLIGSTAANLIENISKGQKIVKTASLPPTRKLPNLKEISDINLFKTNIKEIKIPKPGQDKKKQENIICKSATSKSDLPLKLVNTIVLQDSVKSIAAVQVRSEKDFLNVRINDKIKNLARVDNISRMQIFIKNLQSGNCEFIKNEQEEKNDKNFNQTISVLSPEDSKKYKNQQKEVEGIKNDGNNFTISKKLLMEKLNDIDQILTQARAIPITNSDGSMAFKIVDIVPGSIYSYLGISNGDTINQINGSNISSMNEIMGMFGNIQNISTLSITVSREGDNVDLNYKLTK